MQDTQSIPKTTPILRETNISCSLLEVHFYLEKNSARF